MIRIHVIGTPAPKGSARVIKIGDRAVMVPGGSNKNRTAIKSWAGEVASAARTAIQHLGRIQFTAVPLYVRITFRLVRPSGHYGKNGLKPSAPRAPSVKPDLDKLVRATLDPLEGVVFDGDSRIVDLHARKLYAEPGTSPGALIEIAEWGTTGA